MTRSYIPLSKIVRERARASARRVLFSLWLFCASGASYGQAVDVTLLLETNRIAIGQTTNLRVYAQVTASKRAASERIFSWYLDLLNSSADVAQPDFGLLDKPASDNDPSLSSTGVSAGSNQVGIYDTFLNRPGAGVNTPFLLLSVPVLGVGGGKSTFSIRAGTRADGLSNDFIVAPLAGADPWTGGNYASALAQLEVTGGTNPPFKVSLSRPAPSTPARSELTFVPVLGWNYYVLWSTNVSTASTWQRLPGGPFNSGKVIVTNTPRASFFRVQAERQ